MYVSTSELCDIYQDSVDVVAPIFKNFGGVDFFAGQITTIRCYEDNGLIAKVLAEDGEDRVLVVDGGGIIRTALIDERIAKLAVQNHWHGIIVNGAVRNVTTLSNMEIGIKAISSIPVGASSDGVGEIDVPVVFGGVTFLPEDFIYSDLTGIILSAEVLEY